MQCRRARRRLREHVVCVILGDGLSARLLAMGLFLVKGMLCVICDRRRSAVGYLLPAAVFYGLCHTSESHLLAEQLCDMAEDGEDTLRFLVATTDEYKRITAENRECLESRYILADRYKIFAEFASYRI
ncbi:MAG: hypothetical protein IJY08_05385 [Clostridia bacterium]|nr:hypothetical protein [Clostridia bacterium]